METAIITLWLSMLRVIRFAQVRQPSESVTVRHLGAELCWFFPSLFTERKMLMSIVKRE